MKKFPARTTAFELMRQYDCRPFKALGQNFLIDFNVAEKMADAAQVSAGDCVVEIGPGLGGLTQVLAERSAKVLAIELDKRFVNILRGVFDGNALVEIIQADILKTDIRALMAERGWQTAKLAANLPYYITTPILMPLLENVCPLSSITVMVQKEVAGRLTAKPGGKEYGILSLAASYYAKASIELIVPKTCFVPTPGVDSAVVHLEPVARRLDQQGEKALFKCIKASFGQRRKKLVNCLLAQDWVYYGRNELESIIKGCGFSENVRGESLSLDDFILLSQNL